MRYIVLDDEQAKIVSQTRQGVEVRDRNGNCLGFVTHGIPEEEIEIAMSHLHDPGPYRTTEQVLERLRALEQQHK